MSAEESKRIALFDAVHGISAIIVLAAGLTLWLWVGKPAGFYTDNPVFLVKVLAFVLMGLSAIKPALFLAKHRNMTEPFIDVPKQIVWFIRMELLMLVIMPLLAVLMANGVGLS